MSKINSNGCICHLIDMRIGGVFDDYDLTNGESIDDWEFVSERNLKPPFKYHDSDYEYVYDIEDDGNCAIRNSHEYSIERVFKLKDDNFTVIVITDKDDKCIASVLYCVYKKGVRS